MIGNDNYAKYDKRAKNMEIHNNKYIIQFNIPESCHFKTHFYVTKHLIRFRKIDIYVRSPGNKNFTREEYYFSFSIKKTQTFNIVRSSDSEL